MSNAYGEGHLDDLPHDEDGDYDIKWLASQVTEDDRTVAQWLVDNNVLRAVPTPRGLPLEAVWVARERLLGLVPLKNAKDVLGHWKALAEIDGYS
jgi:hypothetical protein